MPYFVYILQSEKNKTYYVGSTQNLIERLERHNQGRSEHTKLLRPWSLVHFEEAPDRSSAVKRENEIKAHKKRTYIEDIVGTSRQ